MHVDSLGPENGTLTAVSVSTNAATLAAANLARRGMLITNVGSTSLFVGLAATTPTTTLFSVEILSGITYEVPNSTGGPYRGIVQGIRASGTANAVITEMT